jgi:predicted phage baseplate assembly protein
LEVEMPLPVPNLDDRRFQDFVDDAKLLIRQRCPEWSDHNVSDPGVTLIEAVAMMLDQVVYRLNRVPPRLYRTFLDLLGVSLLAPEAARTDLTFRLSAPQPEDLIVRAGTEVATVRDDRTEPITFTTVRDLNIVTCSYLAVATQQAGGEVLDRTEELRDQGFPCWSPTPVPGDTLYVGLDVPTPSCLVALTFDCPVLGVGVTPDDVPWRWEAWDGTSWSACELESDATGGLNQPGDVVLHIPPTHTALVLGGRRAGWLRCVVASPHGRQRAYTESPRPRSIIAATVGGTVEAMHAEIVSDEPLGIAEGVAGQQFPLQRRPVVCGVHPPELEVVDQDGVLMWRSVDSFADLHSEDHAFQLDPVAGVVLLGPAVRTVGGTMRHYGAVPAKGAALRMRTYWTGGGVRGNVTAGTLTVLKTSLPFIRDVRNRRNAAGGVDGESVEEAEVRAPLALRSRRRAVTVQDVEQIARDADRDVARVRCLPVEDAGVAPAMRVLIVPRAEQDRVGRLEWESLIPSDRMLSAVTEELEKARVIGTRINVEPAYYQAVTVVARVLARPRLAVDELQPRLLAALYSYINPLTGGPDGTGWPFGRPVQTGDVYTVLSQVDGVELLEDVRLFRADAVTGQRGDPEQRIVLESNGLAYSYEHRIRVQPSTAVIGG